MARYAGIMTGTLSEHPRNILMQYRRIAMVGVSGNPTRASYRALVHMKSKGYTIYPVNPSYDEILGLKCYKSLLDIDKPVDIVDIFRRPETIMPLVSEAREIGAKVERETRFYITSSTEKADRLGLAVRRHWAVESMHWLMDCIFRDDECRVRSEHAPANFATIKHMALNLLRRHPAKKSMTSKRLAAGWDDDFLVSVIK